MIPVLYEDRELLVCIKPAGLLSQADAAGRPNLVEALQARCAAAVYPVHRLDQGAGGVMVYGKTKGAAAGLSQSMQTGAFSKEYLAVIEGVLDAPAGTFRDYLFKDSAKNKTYVVQRLRKGVKEASLDYEALDRCETAFGPLTLVKIRLHTGRTHQIRVQFASREHPLLGDGKYGSHHAGEALALWSYRLSFPHPVTQAPLTFTQPPPEAVPWAFFQALGKTFSPCETV